MLFIQLQLLLISFMHTSILGQRLHEMILNPPTKIDGLLPLVSCFSFLFMLKRFDIILVEEGNVSYELCGVLN